MANPRKVVSNEGVSAQFATYKIDASTIVYSATATGGSAQVGLAVTLSADDTVALTADAQAVEGKLITVEADGICTVQVEGYCTFAGGSAATLTRGTKVVGALGAASAKGYVRSGASGTAAELLVARGRIVNNGDTANVTVCL